MSSRPLAPIVTERSGVPTAAERTDALTFDLSLIDDELLSDLREMNRAAVNHVKTRLTDPLVDPEAKDRLAIAALPKIVQQATLTLQQRSEPAGGRRPTADSPRTNLDDLLAESGTLLTAAPARPAADADE